MIYYYVKWMHTRRPQTYSTLSRCIRTRESMIITTTDTRHPIARGAATIPSTPVATNYTETDGREWLWQEVNGIIRSSGADGNEEQQDVASASHQQQSSASRLVETNSSSAPGWGWLNNVHSYLLIKHTNSRMVKQRPFFGWLKRLMKKRRFDGILPTNRHNYSGSSGGAASAR